MCHNRTKFTVLTIYFDVDSLNRAHCVVYFYQLLFILWMYLNLLIETLKCELIGFGLFSIFFFFFASISLNQFQSISNLNRVRTSKPQPKSKSIKHTVKDILVFQLESSQWKHTWFFVSWYRVRNCSWRFSISHTSIEVDWSILFTI